MKNITIPRLYCPFTSVLNPHVEAVKEHTDQWISQFNLVPEKDMQKFYDGNYSYLTSRFYPKANYNELCIANDIFSLLFVIDDQIDSPHPDDSQGKENALQQFVRQFMNIANRKINLHEIGKNYHPVLIALVNILERLFTVSDNIWVDAFISEFKNMFTAAVWEHQNTKDKQLPKIEDYLQKRMYSGGTNISLSLIEPAEKIYLSGFIKENVLVQEINKSANKAICIANDLFSFGKEQIFGDEHNLPTIVKNERKVSWEEAVVMAAEIHDKEVRKFAELCEHLPSFNEETDKILKDYINILEWQMIGNIIWSESETKRYSYAYSNDVITTTTNKNM